MKKHLLFFVFLFRMMLLPAQEEGAASAAMGGASVAFASEWSAAGNPAGMTFLKGLSSAIGLSNRFLIKELNDTRVCLTIPVKSIRFGLTAKYYGYSLYSELATGASFSMLLAKKLSAGIRIDWFRISIGEGYGTGNWFSFRVGLLYRVSSGFSAAFMMINPYPVEISHHPPEYLPVTLCGGIRWNLAEKLMMLADLDKDLANPAVFRAGVQYQPVKPVFARIGFMTTPARFTFGFGVSIPYICIDAASAWHPVLGYSPSVSFIFSGKK